MTNRSSASQHQVYMCMTNKHSITNASARTFQLFGLLMLLLMYWGCGNSNSGTVTGPPAGVMPKAGSSFTFVETFGASVGLGFLDTAIVTDSVLESGVALGSHRNVLHVLRITQGALPQTEDLFFNFEPDGDIAQQFGSLAYPDQAAWMLYPFETRQTWNGKVFDSTIRSPGVWARELAYDTSSFAGAGSISVQGRTLTTTRVSMAIGEDLTVFDSSVGFPQTQHAHIQRTVDFAPAIGYFAEDHYVVPQDSSSGTPTDNDIVLVRYVLK